MTVKREKVKNLTNEEIKLKTYKPVPVKEGLPALSFIGGIIAQRGSGKTNAVINLIKHYEATKAFQKIYFFSPSWENDIKYSVLEGSKNYDLQVFTEYSNDIFKDVLKEIKADMKQWWDYDEKKKAYDKFLSDKKLTDEEIVILEGMNYEPPEKIKWDRAPASLLIFDDLAGNKDLYSNNAKGPMHSFAILHRHLLCSVVFICQHFHSAINKQLRNNLSLLILFGNKSKEIKKKIAEEFAGVVEPEKFIELWDEATKDAPWNFFMCDFDQKDPNKKFRKDFDEFFILQ